MRSYLLFIGALTLAAASGFLAGEVFVREPASIVPTVNAAVSVSSVPTVVLSMTQKTLQGSIQGSVRIVANDHVVVPQYDGSFTVTAARAARVTQPITAPTGMQYVASSKGKRYYPIDSPQALSIKVTNRIFFPDAVSAERAGYTRPQTR